MSHPLLVTPGDRAPDFTLASSAGRQVTLADHRGTDRVLLAFFPLAFTSTCTAELCAFSTDSGKFADRGAVVYGISVDSVPTLKAFAAREGIVVELLSDFHRAVSRAYGTLDEAAFFSRRAYVLINRDGAVIWTHVETVLGTRRENAELLALLQGDAA